jgi:small subunit ribosomal protein S8
MLSTDPIADMLTRIRNALAVNKASVLVPFSKVKLAILEQLKESGFILGIKVTEDSIVNKNIIVDLFDDSMDARISEIARVSTPGRRIYAKSSNIPKYKSGRGILIVSTSKGMMTDTEARKAKIGGELICKVS